MNLLNYTKSLHKKISYYDRYIKNSNLESHLQNPFKKQNKNQITIIWVQENLNNK